jgi:alpha-L-fucosidase
MVALVCFGGLLVRGLGGAMERTALPARTPARRVCKPAIFSLHFMPIRFDSSRRSLSTYTCPEWFRDAKFGIWSHWGPQSVPGLDDWDAVAPQDPNLSVDTILPGPSEWYARHMYVQGHRAYRHHLTRYGHPSKHGFKDILPLWRAERWEPERLMDLYVAAGAKYFVSMGVHHDNFDLWDSRLHHWNAAKIGPRRDVVCEWKRAAVARGLRFGVSEHLSASYSWFQTSHGTDATGPMAGVPYDGANPELADYYHTGLPCFTEHVADQWYTRDPASHERWFARMVDLLDVSKPDFFYTDGGIPFGEVGRRLMAHFYNSNQERNGSLEAVYTYKDIGSGEFFPEGGVQDVERGGIADINPLPWQTDTTLSGWFYNSGQKFRTTTDIVHSLADIVSKNGNMLLNVAQLPDGSLPRECETFLAEMAKWMACNGEAIHRTRPWRTAGEGPTAAKYGHFQEGADFTADDVRYTQSKDGRELYAIALGLPTGPLRLTALAAESRPITAVQLLGSQEPVAWSRGEAGLVIQPARTWPTAHAVAFRLTFAV